MSPSPRKGEVSPSRVSKPQKFRGSYYSTSRLSEVHCTFYTMQEQYQKWIDAIKSSEMSESEKQFFSDSVSVLSQTGAPVILTPKHLALLIGIPYPELKKMFYARGRFYRSYTIKKRNGGDRLIEAPYPSLKMVQRWILDNILMPSATFHPSAVGFRKGKTIVDNAMPHLGHDVLLKIDIKDFFPSITEASVGRYFLSLGYTLSLSGTLAYLCCKDGRLPQGAPTSPILSNVLYVGMDIDLNRIAVTEGLSYTRYADDITFSGTHIPVPFIKAVTAEVKDYNLRINKEKTRRSGKGSRKVITGVSISSGKPTIPRTLKRDIRQKVHYILKYGLYDHLKHVESRDLLAGYRLMGLLAYWHSVEPENQYVLDSSRRLGKKLNHGK